MNPEPLPPAEEEEGGKKKKGFCARACTAHTERRNSHKLTQKYPQTVGDVWTRLLTVGRSCRANLRLHIMTAFSADRGEARRTTRVAARAQGQLPSPNLNPSPHLG